MSRKLRFSVNQGIVHANSIQVLQLTPTVLCFSVDFKQKYVDYVGYSFYPKLEFTFGADEDTLGVEDKELQNTDIAVLGFPVKSNSKLHVAVEMGRYSATVSIIRQAEDLEKFQHNHWFDNDKS